MITGDLKANCGLISLRQCKKLSRKWLMWSWLHDITPRHVECHLIMELETRSGSCTGRWSWKSNDLCSKVIGQRRIYYRGPKRPWILMFSRSSDKTPRKGFPKSITEDQDYNIWARLRHALHRRPANGPGASPWIPDNDNEENFPIFFAIVTARLWNDVIVMREQAFVISWSWQK